MATLTAPAPSRHLDRGLGIVVVLGAIMSIIDATAGNVATRTLADDFGASITSVQWVLTGYMPGLAAVIPVTGWATERFGARRVWITALAVIPQHEITVQAPGLGGSALASLPGATRIAVAPHLAAAFGHALWIALVIGALAVIPALLLPRGDAGRPTSG